MKMKRIKFPKISKHIRLFKPVDVKDMRDTAVQSVRTRTFRLGGYSILATVIVIAIAVMVNVSVRALPAQVTQIDTSESDLISLSGQTDDIVGELKDRVDIYWLVQSGQEDATLENLLNRYKSLSGKIVVTKKDPDIYPTFAKEYTSEQIANNSLIVASGDRSKYISYDGQLYEYDYSNYETTGSYDVSFAGESVLTSAIGYVTSDDLPKAYMLEGHGETSLDESLITLVERDNVEIESLSLVSAGSVPEDADLLMICSPQTDVSEAEKEALLDYLANGGRMLLITSAPEDTDGRPNIDAVMKYYGVSAEKGIVMEVVLNNYASGQPYYLLPNIGAHDITTPIVNGGYYVLLPISQGLVVDTELRDGLTVAELLDTSSQSYSKIAGYGIQVYEKEEGDIDGPFALAVAITDTRATEGEGAEEATDAAIDTADGAYDTATTAGVVIDADANTSAEAIDESSADPVQETKIVWIAAASVLDSRINETVSGGNYDFLINAISWMCEQENTISIAPKSLAGTYLTIPSGASSVLSALLVVIIPCVILAIGITVFMRRKRR